MRESQNHYLKLPIFGLENEISAEAAFPIAHVQRVVHLRVKIKENQFEMFINPWKLQEKSRN